VACATSCKTKDHRTYGECLRSKGLSTAAGETTKASGPTQRNDALTAKAAAQEQSPCKIRGPYLPVGDIDWHCRVHKVDCIDAPDGAIVCPVTGRDRAGQEHPGAWLPCALHRPTPHPGCEYCTA
jgi:hypothetical protein